VQWFRAMYVTISKSMLRYYIYFEQTGEKHIQGETADGQKSHSQLSSEVQQGNARESEAQDTKARDFFDDQLITQNLCCRLSD